MELITKDGRYVDVKKVAEEMGRTAAQQEMKEEKKQAKKKVGRTVALCLAGAGLLCAGYMIGVHRHVIAAWIKGEEMPKAPWWHTWCW